MPRSAAASRARIRERDRPGASGDRYRRVGADRRQCLAGRVAAASSLLAALVIFSELPQDEPGGGVFADDRRQFGDQRQLAIGDRRFTLSEAGVVRRRQPCASAGGVCQLDNILSLRNK